MSKARKLDRRDEWKSEQDACMTPGCKATVRGGSVLDCHEIVGGSDKPRAMTMPATWLALCRSCHDKLGSRPNNESLARQLAVKKWADPENYDLTAVVRLYYPTCQPAFIEQIDAAVKVEYNNILRDWT